MATVTVGIPDPATCAIDPDAGGNIGGPFVPIASDGSTIVDTAGDNLPRVIQFPDGSGVVFAVIEDGDVYARFYIDSSGLNAFGDGTEPASAGIFADTPIGSLGISSANDGNINLYAGISEIQLNAATLHITGTTTIDDYLTVSQDLTIIGALVASGLDIQNLTVELSGSFAGDQIFSGGTVTFVEDTTFAGTEFGPVLQDQTDEHTYRLITTNGIVSAVLVA